MTPFTSLSKRIRAVSLVFLGVYLLLSLAFGITVPKAEAKILGFLPTVLVGAFALLDNWLWRQSWVLPFMKQPLLRGTWHGTLTSYRRDGKDKKVSTTHDVVIVIRQSLLSISVTLMTKESTSRSSTAQILTNQADDYTVQYQYNNRPKLQFRDRSQEHVGGSCFDVSGSQPTVLEGEYWTARDTKGTYKLARVSEKHAGNYEQGLEYAQART